MERTITHVRCLHLTDLLETSEVVSNYHPITKREIRKLLNLAKKNSGDVAVVSSVQIRLAQGIVGAVCPANIEGRVTEQEIKLDQLFIDEYKRGGKKDLVDRIYQIQNWNQG